MHATQLVYNYPCNNVMQVFTAQAVLSLEGQQMSPALQFMVHLNKVAKCVNLASIVPLGLVQILLADKVNIVRILRLQQVVDHVKADMHVGLGKL